MRDLVVFRSLGSRAFAPGVCDAEVRSIAALVEGGVPSVRVGRSNRAPTPVSRSVALHAPGRGVDVRSPLECFYRPKAGTALGKVRCSRGSGQLQRLSGERRQGDRRIEPFFLGDRVLIFSTRCFSALANFGIELDSVRGGRCNG